MNDAGRSEFRTVATLLTGSGRGAISVVRVIGPEALRLVDREFRPRFGRSLLASPLDLPRLGRFGGDLGDEVVIVPISDGPPEVEIHGHGGTAAVAAILAALASLGVRVIEQGQASPDEDAAPWSVRARSALARASTLRVAEILLDQCAGALDEEWKRLLEHFSRECSGCNPLLEGEAPSEPLPGRGSDGASPSRRRYIQAKIALEKAASDPDRARVAVGNLISRAGCGVRMVEGWTVALTGRPNVGKSRLLNALAGFRRAVVSDAPGTTRDVVGARTAFEGWPVELLDMAGLRPTDDPIEAEGMARARALLARSDLVLAVFDASQPLTQDDREVLEGYPRAICVANKSDLPEAWPASDVGAIRVSAATGDGLSELSSLIASRIVPEPPAPGVAVPFTQGLLSALEMLRDRLDERR